MAQFGGQEITKEILEQTNPVYNTAKMTLFLLAGNGDPDAVAITRMLELTQAETQNSKNTTASQEQVIAGALNMEVRFRSMGILEAESGCPVHVDLPCGYTPRFVQDARAGRRYVGMDLPAVIADMEKVADALLSEEEKKLVSFKAVDATNYATLESALEGVEGPLCITTEGLVMYFTDSEAEVFLDNIRLLLEKHGGCWITADPEITLAYIMALRAVCGERFMEVMSNAKQQASDKSNTMVGGNKLMSVPPDIEGTMKAAMMLLAKHGMKAERKIIADCVPELVTLAKIPEQAEAYKASLKQCANWKVTLLNPAQKLDTSAMASKQFDASAALQDGTMTLNLKGRLDTMTAPSLLAFYEQNKDSLQGVVVDCAELDYISSAGLRVLLIMQKGCAEGVRLRNVNALVTEILGQTGFDSVLAVE
jgi:anti-anti-sigma factor